MVRVQQGPPSSDDEDFIIGASSNTRSFRADNSIPTSVVELTNNNMDRLDLKSIENNSFSMLHDQNSGSQSRFYDEDTFEDESLRSDPMQVERLQKQVKSLLSENNQYKVTLDQNNEILQKHIRSLYEWKHQILFQKNQQQHEIERLKKENKELKGASGKDKKASKNVEEKKEETDPEVQGLKDNFDSLVLEGDKLREKLSRAASQKEILESDLTSLKKDNDVLRSENESLVAEKYQTKSEIEDVQKQLQQTVAKIAMQDNHNARLQEELQKLQASYAEEQKVREKLSRNLEIERRRNESLEQRVKNRLSGGSTLTMPDEMRLRDDILATSIEKYRMHCELMSNSLLECEKKLASFEIQEDYHVQDLHREIERVKELILREIARTQSDNQELEKVQSIFGNVYKDYLSAIEALRQITNAKQLESKQRFEKQDQSKIHELSARFLEAKEILNAEKQNNSELQNRIRQLEEESYVIRTENEIYRSDFQEERCAREKIAGEKADLEEQLRLLKRPNNRFSPNPAEQGAVPRRNPSSSNVSKIVDKIHDATTNLEWY